MRSEIDSHALGMIEADLVLRHDRRASMISRRKAVVMDGFSRKGLGLALGIPLFGTMPAGPFRAGTTAALAQAEAQTIDRSAKGPSAQSIQVGVYLNVRPD